MLKHKKHKNKTQLFVQRKTGGIKNITRLIKIILIAVIVLLCGFTFALIFQSENTTKIRVKLLPQEVKTLVIKENNTFSKERFIKELKVLKFKFPHIVYAQAVKESGFKSAIFKENNNMFGMKLARSRPTTAIGVNRKHAEYTSWRDCVIDYLLYQSCYLRHINSEEEYFQYLRSYAQDPNYSESIRRLSKKYKKLFKK